MSVVLPEPAAARAWCAEHAEHARGLGFVPTMGALHEGHLSLVRRSVAENGHTCVSVFVNPLQFDDPEDLARYPRDLARDAALLQGVGCDMVFSGSLEEFFPEHEPDSIPLCDPGAAAVGLEGEFRAGHFAGVATIVARLFELVIPSRAYFGAKDYQQTLVVKYVARELGFPEIVVCPTSREPDGLARSSRNVRLSGEGRSRALVLVGALRAARAAWRAGERDPGRLRAALLGELDVSGVELEYAELRHPERWDAELPADQPIAWKRIRALVAARVDGVRLIDNLALEAEPGEPGEPRRGRARGGGAA